MRMAGELIISNPGTQIFKSKIRKDGWKQTPGKIMFGDGLTWTRIISLPYKRNRNGDYLTSSIEVQP